MHTKLNGFHHHDLVTKASSEKMWGAWSNVSIKARQELHWAFHFLHLKLTILLYWLSSLFTAYK
jgi:hypothetical protein